MEREEYQNELEEVMKVRRKILQKSTDYIDNYCKSCTKITGVSFASDHKECKTCPIQIRLDINKKVLDESIWSLRDLREKKEF